MLVDIVNFECQLYLGNHSAMKIMLSFFLLLFMPSMAWSHDMMTKNGGSLFNVDITIDAASLDTDLYKKFGVFYIDTKVTNTNDHKQKIIAWTQYGWSWVSNMPDVSPGTEAAKNGRSEIILQPGESYKHKVEMFSNSHRPVSFQLGFTPNAERPLSGQPNLSNNGEIFWSNPVTLTR